VQRLEQAITGLEQSLKSSPGWPQSWRLSVRQRLLDLADALCDEAADGDDTALSARADGLCRERRRLLTQVSLLLPEVAESRDLDGMRRKLIRLVHDVEHHNQRVHDLLYDAVGMEVGGSE
jgi:hypothetical protein